MPAELSRVETIFNDALEIAAPQERAAFLDRACGDDADLRRRVEALLAAHDNTGDVLRLPPIGLNSGTVDYLPASNTLCEVRNEQGVLLWSLFDTAGDSPRRTQS